MLHTNEDDCSLALQLKRLKPERLSCIGRMHNGLCVGCPHTSPVLVVKLAKRIPLGQQENSRRENTRKPNKKIIKQF